MRLNRHIRSDRAKWTVTGFLFVVILAALVLGGLQLWGADSAKPGNWGEPTTKQEQTVPDEGEQTPDKGEQTLDEGGEAQD